MEKGDECAHTCVCTCTCKHSRENGTIQGSRTSFLVVPLCLIDQSKPHWCLGHLGSSSQGAACQGPQKALEVSVPPNHKAIFSLVPIGESLGPGAPRRGQELRRWLILENSPWTGKICLSRLALRVVSLLPADHSLDPSAKPPHIARMEPVPEEDGELPLVSTAGNEQEQKCRRIAKQIAKGRRNPRRAEG